MKKHKRRKEKGNTTSNEIRHHHHPSETLLLPLNPLLPEPLLLLHLSSNTRLSLRIQLISILDAHVLHMLQDIVDRIHLLVHLLLQLGFHVISPDDGDPGHVGFVPELHDLVVEVLTKLSRTVGVGFFADFGLVVHVGRHIGVDVRRGAGVG